MHISGPGPIDPTHQAGGASPVQQVLNTAKAVISDAQMLIQALKEGADLPPSQIHWPDMEQMSSDFGFAQGIFNSIVFQNPPPPQLTPQEMSKLTPLAQSMQILLDSPIGPNTQNVSCLGGWGNMYDSSGQTGPNEKQSKIMFMGIATQTPPTILQGIEANFAAVQTEFDLFT